MSSPTKTAPELPAKPADVAEMPAPIGRTVVLCVIALIFGIGIAIWLGRANTGTYVGYLQAQKISLVATSGGTIQEIIADEGQFVTADAPVLMLHQDELVAKIEALRKAIAAAENALSRATAQAEVDIAWRLKQLEEEILATRLRSAELLQVRFDQELKQQALDESLKEARAAVDSVNKLHLASHQPASGRVDVLVEKETAANAVEVANVQIELCETRLQELESLKASLKDQIRRAAGVEELEASLASEKAELASLEEQEQEVQFDSSIDGVVGVYQKRTGETVAAGETIVDVLNEEQRFLLVEIPSRSLVEFQDGAEVMLEFPGGIERKGTVHRIPPQAIRMDRSPADAVATLRINPIGKHWPALPIGSAISVTPVE